MLVFTFRNITSHQPRTWKFSKLSWNRANTKKLSTFLSCYCWQKRFSPLDLFVSKKFVYFWSRFPAPLTSHQISTEQWLSKHAKTGVGEALFPSRPNFLPDICLDQACKVEFKNRLHDGNKTLKVFLNSSFRVRYVLFWGAVCMKFEKLLFSCQISHSRKSYWAHVRRITFSTEWNFFCRLRKHNLPSAKSSAVGGQVFLFMRIRILAILFILYVLKRITTAEIGFWISFK